MTFNRPFLPTLCGTALLAGAAGCASLPPAGPAGQMIPAADYASAQALQAPTSPWPADDWWAAYGDPQLDHLIAEALAGSPDMAAAQARVRRAQAAAAQRSAALGPTVSLSVSAQETKQSYNNGIPPAFVPQGYNDAGRLALDFSWELDFWGRNRAAVAAATSEMRAAQAEAAESRLILSTSVAAAYADLFRLFAERDLAERAVALRQETSALVAQRVSGGLDTRAELRQSQAEPLAARSDLLALDAQIAATRNRLAALLGAGPDRGLAVARPAAARLRPLGLPQTVALDLVGRRPDVVAARWRAEAAQDRIRGARAAFYPNVNLAALIGFQALHLDKLFAEGSDIGAVGPAVSLPVFDGGGLRAGLRGAQADRDAAVASYNGAVVEALRQVADAVSESRSLSARMDHSRAALAASEDAYRLARLRYEGGLNSYASVLIAEQAVLGRRRAVADLDSRALAVDVALVRALGGGFHQP